MGGPGLASLLLIIIKQVLGLGRESLELRLVCLYLPVCTPTTLKHFNILTFSKY